MATGSGKKERVRPLVESLPKGSAVAALASLDQVFSLSTLYPAEHNRFGRAVAQFRQDLEACSLDTFAIELGEECLRIGGEELSADSPRVGKLHALLKELGLAGLDFDPSFKPEDLHRFALLLQRLRHGALASKGFSQLDFSHLPATIRVRQREFGSFFRPRLGVAGKGADGAQATSAKGSLDALLEAILTSSGDGEGRPGGTGRAGGSPGAPEGVVASPAEAIITRVFTRLLERAGRKKEKTGVPFNRSIDEVMELGIPILQETIAALLRGEEEASSLAEVVEIVEKALDLTRNNEAVTCLLRVMRDTAGRRLKPQQEAQPAGKKKEEISIDPEELRQLLEEYTADAEPINRVALEDRCEFLALLGGILLADPGAKVVNGAGSHLRRAAAEGLQPQEIKTLVRTTREILGRNDPALVDQSLPMILRALRLAKVSCVGPFLAELCQVSTMTELLWPHLVNELLVGFESGDRKERRLFQTLASGLPEETMKRNLPRLEGLSALAQGQLAKGLFDPPERALFPLYAVLLESSQGEIIGDLVCKSLAARKSSWPGMEALKFIEHYRPIHLGLLAGLLREDQVEEKSYALREKACALINEGLLSLLPGSRDQKWLAGPIEALSSLQIEEGRRSLGRITGQRKWLLFPAWPGWCREEAKRALHRLSTGSEREGHHE